MIWNYKNNSLCARGSLLEALELEGENPLVAAVGAGGKTSILHRLAEEYIRKGRRVLVTTTTHIMKEDEPYFLPDPDMEKIRDCLSEYRQVWTGQSSSGNKLKSLGPELIAEIGNMGLPVLIEADGAKRMPLKVPAAHEPVLLPKTDCVLSVYGLDALGERIEDVCFRPELAEKILGKKRTEKVTVKDIALLAASPRAGKKGCPECAAYTVILNKADDSRRRGQAAEICAELEERGIRGILVSAHLG